MSRDFNKVARRYARALYLSVLSEQGQGGEPSPAQRLSWELQRFAYIWDTEAELRSSILNPMFNKSERLSAMIELLRLGGFPDLSQRFIQVLFDRDRIAALPEVVRAFALIADEGAGVVNVKIEVAKEISWEEKQSIEAGIRERLNGNLQFAWSEDPSLIGGMLVSYSGKVLDASVRGRLERVERHLLATHSG